MLKEHDIKFQIFLITTLSKNRTDEITNMIMTYLSKSQKLISK